MKVKVKNNLAINILIGIAAGMVVSGVLISIAAKMMILQKLGEVRVATIATLILLLGTLTGNCMSVMLQGDHVLRTVAITTTGILLMVVTAAFTMEGPINDMLQRALTILMGGLISCVICMKKKGKSGKRKRHYR